MESRTCMCLCRQVLFSLTELESLQTFLSRFSGCMGSWLSSSWATETENELPSATSMPISPPSAEESCRESQKKRCRVDGNGNTVSAACTEIVTRAAPGTDPLAATIFSLSPKYETIAYGDSVEQRYGCRYHVYETNSVNDSHGVALVQVAPSSNMALLRQARLANSVKKSLIVLLPPVDTAESITAIKLTYRAEL